MGRISLDPPVTGEDPFPTASKHEIKKNVPFIK